MEELNLTELLKYYLKRIPVIVLATILALLIGYFYIKEVQVPLYHGTTTIILVQQQEQNQSSTMMQSELTINEKLVSTYSQIIKSRRVLDQVIATLNLDTTTNNLANNITVTSVSETSIIKVTVSDEDKELAPVIANQIAKVFETEVTKIYNLENISVIDEAIMEENPYNVNVPKQMIIYALIGLVLSCGIIFVMYYFDNTIKNKKEIETKLNLAVLGEIPVATRLKIQLKKPQKIESTTQEPQPEESNEKANQKEGGK